MNFTSPAAEDGVRAARCVVARVAEDETIVVPVDRSAENRDSVYRFNESGAKLWDMIREGRGVAELAARLESEYGLSPGEAAADAIEFVAGLAREGLIEPK
ncbi:MAG: PqqD family protein [Candidatus Acidiferrales bacterium]